MFLIKFLFWLVTFPIRLVFWVVGLALWILTLPLRIVFGFLGLIGFGRIVQLAFLAGAGYYFYRLVNQATENDAIEPPTTETLETYPST